MFVSSKTKSALKIIEFLKSNELGETKKGKEIAAYLEKSSPYMEQIMFVLVAAGIVESVRGAKGGYKLNPLYIEHSVWDVINLFPENGYVPEGTIIDELHEEFCMSARAVPLITGLA